MKKRAPWHKRLCLALSPSQPSKRYHGTCETASLRAAGRSSGSAGRLSKDRERPKSVSFTCPLLSISTFCAKGSDKHKHEGYSRF